MTLTSAEVAKMQRHNADLVRENETLTRDNAELQKQIRAIKKVVKTETNDICLICKHRKLFHNEEPCLSCYPQNNALEWQPPDA